MKVGSGRSAFFVVVGTKRGGEVNATVEVVRVFAYLKPVCAQTPNNLLFEREREREGEGEGGRGRSEVLRQWWLMDCRRGGAAAERKSSS